MACTGAVTRKRVMKVLQKDKDENIFVNEQELQVTKLPRPSVCNSKMLRATRQHSVTDLKHPLPKPPSSSLLLLLSSITHGSLCWDLMASQLGRPSRVHSAGNSPGPRGVHPSVRVGQAAAWRKTVSRISPLIFGEEVFF